MSLYSIVSLFSGAGGLDLGFVNTGKFRIVFANDILVQATKTYSKNFGLRHEACPEKGVVDAVQNTVLACDVARVDFTSLEGVGVDVVIGGPPCQDFSIIRGPQNKRLGIEVQRGRLYSHFVRALIHLQPKMFVFENVPGLVSANKGLAYKTIIEDFQNLKVRWEEVKRVINVKNSNRDVQGYEILFSDTIDMTKLGLPQKRERLIIIGLRRDLADKLGARALWSEFRQLTESIASKLRGVKSIFSRFPLTPIEVFEGDVLPNLQDRYREIMKEWEGVWEEVGTAKAWEWKQRVWDKLSFDIIKDYLFLNKVKNYSSSELEEAFQKHQEILKELGYLGRNVKDLQPSDGSNSIPDEAKSVIERMMRIPPGENHEFVKGTKWEVRGLMSNIYRRAHPLVPAPTVIAYGGGGTWGYHYERKRSMLTNRERARLQSFPDDFLFTGTWSEVRAQIGEAVPPIVTKRIAEIVANILNMIS
ncbi:MAG: DNA cytosine methyltransferase [Thermosphaera sp.]